MPFNQLKNYAWSQLGHVVQRLVEAPDELHEQTSNDNPVASVTDGTAVLGYGKIGPRAGMPVMEGKAAMTAAERHCRIRVGLPG